MKINLKSLAFQSSLILALTLAFLPQPTSPVPEIPSEPLLRPISPNLPNSSAYPVNNDQKPPWLSARGVYIIDTNSMIPILTKNPNLKLRPASITKIMTALVAMDEFGPSDIVTSKNGSNAIGKTIRLKNGEQISFLDSLYALLLESGNDVALTLAENYPGGYNAIVQAMNQKAKKLNLNHTTYQNVSGIDQFQHQTTVHDLGVLTAYAMGNQQFAQIVATEKKEIKSISGEIVHSLKNTNQLLGTVDGVLGVKTGWTRLAGESLVTYVERNGHGVILVILGSTDRFGETNKLIDWVFTNHQWQNPF